MASAAPSAGNVDEEEESDFSGGLSLAELFLSRDYVTEEHVYLASSRFPHGLRVSVDALTCASTDFDLTGQVLWIAARLAAWYMSTPAAIARWAGVDALELGAGAGLMGLVAAQYARSVILTDNEDEVLALLRRNLRHVPAACASAVHALSWGSDADHAALTIATGRTGFPLLLACDVVYWSVSITPLFNSVARLLERPGGVFVLAFTNRNSSMHEEMLRVAAAVGLARAEIPQAAFMPAGLAPGIEHALKKCFLYEFTWAQAAAAGPAPDFHGAPPAFGGVVAAAAAPEAAAPSAASDASATAARPADPAAAAARAEAPRIKEMRLSR